ncbi:MAG: CAP domain-containing protein [Chloroflexi bacterium]|nr:CAP domain-containing protein [Chloroflexota bacterium]
MRRSFQPTSAVVVLFLVTLGCATMVPGATSPATPVPLPTYTAYPTWTPPAPQATEAPTEEASDEVAEAPTATPIPPEPTPINLEPVELEWHDPREVEVLALVNEWRLSVGAWPVHLNNTLAELAQVQADFLASQSDIPDDVHIGADGSQPFDRLRAAGWPTYLNTDQVEGGEVVYIGASPSSATNWWFNSPIHRQTIENTAFREVGIGIQDHTWGSIFVILFGSQPDRLTALYDPHSHHVYVSSENSKYAAGGDWIITPTHLQIVGTLDAPTDDTHWQAYHETIDPPNDLEYFTIVLTDGVHETRVEVNITLDVAWLPETYPKDGIIKGIPTELLREASADHHEIVLDQREDGHLDHFNASVLHHDRRLVLANTSDQPVDFSGISLLGANGYELRIESWAVFMDFGTVLAAIPAKHCFVAFANDDTYPGTPDECEVVVSVVSVPPDVVFWNDEDFEVLQNGSPLITCQTGAGRCAFEVAFSD